MAASITFCDSSLPPRVFRLNSSTNYPIGAISVAIERCQLCGGTKRTFTCVQCIKDGDFVHSKCQFRNDSENEITTKTNGSTERYAEKLKRWKELQKSHHQLQQRVFHALEDVKPIDSKVCEIQKKKDSIQYLRAAVEKAKLQLHEDKESLTALQSENSHRHSKSLKHKEKRERLLKYLQFSQESINTNSTTLEVTLDKLAAITTQRIRELTDHIFTLNEFKQPHESTDSIDLSQSTVHALDEASRMTYMNGHWIQTNRNLQYGFQIVEPIVPGNGDYSEYKQIENKTETRSPETVTSHNDIAYSLTAGLGFTSQFITELSYMLDVPLPRKQNCSVFYKAGLTEERFHQEATNLNHNVLYLCFSQHVPQDKLIPKHTLHNLLQLLQLPTLGRCTEFEVDTTLLSALDESAVMDTSSDFDSDEPTPYSEFANIEPEWERVKSSDTENLSHASEMYATGGASAPVYASTLISSAASTVANLWRGAW